MKKVLALFLIVVLLFVTGVAFADDYGEQNTTAARAYLERTELTELFTRKNEDYPFELVLPDWVWKSLTEKEIHEEVYKKVGIDLKEEVKLGRLYVKDGKYYINFKEKKIEKKAVKELRKCGIKTRMVSIREALTIDGFNLKGFGLKDPSDLKYFINSVILILSKNQEIKDYSFLVGLYRLRSLDLDNNNITELSILSDIKSNISDISLQNNSIIDISFLAKFRNLRMLFLSNNRIISLKGLENLKKLEELFIDGNPITLDGLQYIEQLCYSEVLWKLHIDRKVFREYGEQFALYPVYLQWIERIYFYEEDGSVKEWY